MNSKSWITGALLVGAVALACVGSTPAPLPSTANCQDYCTQVMNKCTATDADGNNLVYKNQATCLDMCAKIPAGTSGSASGDTIACRLVNLSALDDVDAHFADHHAICLESAAFGCNDPCEAFCTLDEAICTGTLAQYKDHADCLTTCKGFDPTFTGPFVGSTGNNLQCRMYHLENAVIDPASHTQHCPHTGAGTPGFGTALCNSGVADAGADASANDASTDAKTD